MRRASILTAVLAIGLLTVSVPASAFHGASWRGQGTATHIGTGETRHAVVDWSGALTGGFGPQPGPEPGPQPEPVEEPADAPDLGLGQAKGVARIQIGGAFQATVVANEDTSNTFIDGCIETVSPYVLTGTADLGTVFQLSGTMVNDLCSDCFCKTDSHYEGRLGPWQLSIDVVGDKDSLDDG